MQGPRRAAMFAGAQGLWASRWGHGGASSDHGLAE